MAFVLIRPRKKVIIEKKVKELTLTKPVEVKVVKTVKTQAPTAKAAAPTPAKQPGEIPDQLTKVMLKGEVVSARPPDKTLSLAEILVRVAAENGSNTPVEVIVWPDVEAMPHSGDNWVFPGGIVDLELAGLETGPTPVRKGNQYQVVLEPGKKFVALFNLKWENIPHYHYDMLSLALKGGYRPKGSQAPPKQVLLGMKHFNVEGLTADYPEYRGGGGVFTPSQLVGPGSKGIHIDVSDLSRYGFHIDAWHEQKDHFMSLQIILESLKDLAPGSDHWGRWRKYRVKACGGEWYQYVINLPAGITAGVPAGQHLATYVEFGSPLPDGDYRLIIHAANNDKVIINPSGQNQVEKGWEKTVQISFSVRNGAVIVGAYTNLRKAVTTVPGPGKAGGGGKGKRYVQPVPSVTPAETVEGRTRKKHVIATGSPSQRRKAMMKKIMEYESKTLETAGTSTSSSQGKPSGQAAESSQPTTSQETSSETSSGSIGAGWYKKQGPRYTPV